MVSLVSSLQKSSIGENSKGKTKSISRNSHKIRKRGGEGSVRRSTSSSNNEPQFVALQRAKELQANLSPQLPSFVKHMLPSHVTGGFWLGLPRKFCDMYMPKVDTIIALEDESGELYRTKYLADKVGLSGGWRGFSMAHNLIERDVLVFHLVQHFKFKVYILRYERPDNLDGAIGLLKLDNSINSENGVDTVLDAIQENDSVNMSMVLGAILSQPEELEQKSEVLAPEAYSGIRIAESSIRFEEVTGLENFSIIVDRLVLDSEFYEHIWAKYYELCRSQGCFLHENLLGGLNCNLIVGMISETTCIADAIKASKVRTCVDDFVTWDQTLKGMELMGMNVGFLLVRLDKLMKLALKLKRYRDARLERLHAKEKLKGLEAQVLEVKQTIRRLDEEIAMQDMNPETVETMFQELANAPW